MVLMSMPEFASIIAFITPFPAPSSTMIIKMPQATAKPVSAVLSLLRLMLSHIS